MSIRTIEDYTPHPTQPNQAFIAILDSIPIGTPNPDKNLEREAKLILLQHLYPSNKEVPESTRQMVGLEYLYGQTHSWKIRGIQPSSLVCPCQAESVLNPTEHTHINWTPQQREDAEFITTILTEFAARTHRLLAEAGLR